MRKERRFIRRSNDGTRSKKWNADENADFERINADKSRSSENPLRSVLIRVPILKSQATMNE
jgi:hypothetical protein